MTIRRLSSRVLTMIQTETTLDWFVTAAAILAVVVIGRCVPPTQTSQRRVGLESSRVAAGQDGPRYYLTLRRESPGLHELEEREVTQREYLRLHDLTEACEYGERLEPCAD